MSDVRNDLNKMHSVCLIVDGEDVILAAAPLGMVDEGDLVELNGCREEIFQVKSVFGYGLIPETKDYLFLESAHGDRIQTVSRVYRSAWEVTKDDL